MSRYKPLFLMLGLALPALAHDLSDPHFVTGNFERADSLARLPQSVREAVHNAIRDPSCPGIADVGQRFSSTCTVIAGTPCRRLIVAGRIGDLWFVLYEAGGVAHNRNMIVMQVREGKVSVTWSYLRVGDHPIAVEDLQRHVAQGDPCLVTPPREHYQGNELELCLRGEGA